MEYSSEQNASTNMNEHVTRIETAHTTVVAVRMVVHQAQTAIWLLRSIF